MPACTERICKFIAALGSEAIAYKKHVVTSEVVTRGEGSVSWYGMVRYGIVEFNGPLDTV